MNQTMLMTPETQKRVRFTHKPVDKRADLETTDDTVTKGAKLLDSQSSSSSSHLPQSVFAPNLHDSSAKLENPNPVRTLRRGLELVPIWKSVHLKRS